MCVLRDIARAAVEPGVVRRGADSRLALGKRPGQARRRVMRLRTLIGLLGLAAALTFTMASSAAAGVFTRSPLQVVSVACPFAGCDIAGLAAGGLNFLNAEVAPWVDA